jgi:hypothetical protein
MDTAVHDCLDEGSDILVLDSPLAQEFIVSKSGSVRSEGHRLVLEAKISMHVCLIL